MKKLISILFLYIISVSSLFACGWLFEGHETMTIDGKEVIALHGCDVSLVDYIIPWMKFIVIIIAWAILINTFILIKKTLPNKTQGKNTKLEKIILMNAIIPLFVLWTVTFVIKWIMIGLFGQY